MSVHGDLRSEPGLTSLDPFNFDPDWKALLQDIEALEQYLSLQNLRRLEEERFVRLMEGVGR